MASTKSNVFSLWGLLQTPFFAALVSATCYRPDGTALTDPAYQPCNQFVGSQSMCCGTNHTGGIVAADSCLPNGLCQNSYEGRPLMWRGSCTDYTWKSPYCLGGFCVNDEDDNGNAPVINCNDGTWCCGGSNTTCCDTKQGVKLAESIGPTSTTSSATFPTISLKGSSTSASTTTSSQIAPPSQTTTGTPTTTPSPSHGLPTSVKVGICIGVGVALLIATIAVAAWIYLQRQWRRRLEAGRTKSKDARPSHGSALELNGNVNPAELHSYRSRAELLGDGNIPELEGRMQPVELEGGRRGYGIQPPSPAHGKTPLMR